MGANLRPLQKSQSNSLQVLENREFILDIIKILLDSSKLAKDVKCYNLKAYALALFEILLAKGRETPHYLTLPFKEGLTQSPKA
ncbi:MAG: hypothetical protein ACFFD2_10405 [Promethearchaeota archaeon]